MKIFKFNPILKTNKTNYQTLINNIKIKYKNQNIYLVIIFLKMNIVKKILNRFKKIFLNLKKVLIWIKWKYKNKQENS